MVIPHDQLSPEALRGVIEEFVTREGTDDGDHEADLAARVALVRRQLDAGTAVLVYDEVDGTCTILPRTQLPAGEP